MSNLLSHWTTTASTPTSSIILPDGCRDLICREQSGQAPSWFVSPLQTTSMRSEMREGERLTGFRLAAGSRINRGAMLEVLQGEMADPQKVHEILDDLCWRSPKVAEALACLAQAETVAIAANELGVSLRRLQRLIARETGYSPGFWHQLARVRSCARQVSSGTPLSEAAYDAGFADQAHMSRAFRRWFNTTPSQFLASPSLCGQLDVSAYA